MSSTSISLLTINHSGLSTRHRSARFCWLPSHVGIPGYEQADQANLYFDPFNHPLHFYPFQHHPHPRQLQLLPISILPTLILLLPIHLHHFLQFPPSISHTSQLKLHVHSLPLHPLYHFHSLLDTHVKPLCNSLT